MAGSRAVYLFLSLTLMSSVVFANCRERATPYHEGEGVLPVLDTSRITLPFGSFFKPYYYPGKPHTGTDIARSRIPAMAERARNLVAISLGCVSEIGTDLYLGNYVIVTSSIDRRFYARKIAYSTSGSKNETPWPGLFTKGDEFSVLYAHMERSLVRAGQLVQAGTPVGVMGMSGQVTGIHVHLELKYGRQGLHTGNGIWRRTSYYDILGLLHGLNQDPLQFLVDVSQEYFLAERLNESIYPYYQY